MEKSCLAIVPARRGSKGVKDKNIRLLLGKPLIAYTINEARKCKAIGKIIVSTDSRKIRDIAIEFGAEVPFLRPNFLAADITPMYPVIRHAVECIESRDEKFDIVLILQPTSPLRIAADINKAIATLIKTGADSVVGVCLSEHSPYWMRVLKHGRVYPLIKAREYMRRQDLPEVYRINGAIYVTRRNVLLEQGKILGKDTRALVMPIERSIDIDTDIDFKYAELFLKNAKRQ